MKKAFAIVVFCLCILLSACSPEPEPINDAPEKLGISSGNFLNQGFVAQNEGDPYYYYSHYATEGDRSQNGIYRVNTETGERFRLSEQTGSYLNLYDGYLYYRTLGNSEWRSLVWRVKCDGSSPPEEYYQTLYNITGGIMIANDMLFVVNTEGLCVATLKDSGPLTDGDMTIVAQGCGHPVVLSDTLYYSHLTDRMDYYRSKPLSDLKASHKIVVQDEYISHSMAGYGYLYYIDNTNYIDYYRASLTDGKVEKILTLKGNMGARFNLYKGHLYYMDEGYIYRCDLDGDHLEKVLKTSWKEGLTKEERSSTSWHLFIANDTIYIFNYDLGRVVRQIDI